MDYREPKFIAILESKDRLRKRIRILYFRQTLRMALMKSLTFKEAMSASQMVKIEYREYEFIGLSKETKHYIFLKYQER